MGEPALPHARRGAVVAIVAALLLANPLYVGLFVDPPRTRSPTGYAATAVDPSQPDDQRTIIARLGDEEILDMDRLSAESADDDPDESARYRAPERAAEVLRQAREQGTARTDNESASFTLHRVGASHRYVTYPDAATNQYYRFDVTERNGTTVVTTTPVTQSAVSQYLVYKDSRLYTSLPEYQRETVEKVIAADRSGYRPYNEEFEHLTDTLIIKDGTYYVFTTGIHVDDFGITTRDMVSFALSVLGALALLVAIAFTALAYRSDSRAKPSE